MMVGLTSALIRKLHEVHILPDELHQWFNELGLTTLKLRGTGPDGLWRPPGVADTTGAFEMTSLDTARLVWLSSLVAGCLEKILTDAPPQRRLKPV